MLLKLSLLGFLGVAQAQYPSTYPFENEGKHAPALLPAAEPDWTFETNTDPGGYIYRGTLCDMNDHDFSVRGYSMCSDCGTCMAHLVYSFALPPMLPMQTWNCSATGLKFSEADFFGEVGGKQIECAAAQCCSEFLGKPAYTLDAVSFHEKWNNYITVGACKTSLPEALYCAEIAYDWVCFDRFVSPDERTHIEACYNMVNVYFRECAVYNGVGVNSENEAYETKMYLSALSPDESFSVYGVHTYTDRICHPYTYYFPVSENDGDEESAAETETSHAISWSIVPVILAMMN